MAAPGDDGGMLGATGEIPQSPNTRRRPRGREVVVVDGNLGVAPITNTDNMANTITMTQVQPLGELSPRNPLLTHQRQHMAPGAASTRGTSNNSSAPSPDEMVIQARGRRQMPLTFSPDVHHTPIGQKHAVFKAAGIAHSGSTPASINRLLLPTRTSPRKRLQLTDSPPKAASAASSSSHVASSLFLTPSPEKMNKRSPVPKRNRAQAVAAATAVAAAIDSSSPCHDTSLNSSFQRPGSATLMKGLSPAQLITMVSGLVDAHPELEQEVEEMLPQPDLAPLEEKLLYLKRNIFKSLPNTRLESKTDSMAYNRASTHLLAFKKALRDQAKSLQDSQQWESLLDYCLMAWGYVKATPTWDNPPHNNVRKQCFKALAAFLSTALKRGEWGLSTAVDIRTKVGVMAKETEDLQGCMKQLDAIVNNGNVTI